VLAAVERRGSALAYASQELQADEELVLAAVKSEGSALQHASKPLRCHLEIALAAVRRDPGALEFIAKEDDPRLLQAISPSVLHAVDSSREREFQQNRVQEVQPLPDRIDDLPKNADLIPGAPSATPPEKLEASMREDAPSLSHGVHNVTSSANCCNEIVRAKQTVLAKRQCKPDGPQPIPSFPRC